MEAAWLEAVKWDARGLAPVIVQEMGSNDILMFAWMNRTALLQTAETGRAVYWSRSRERLWLKGEESGHIQYVRELRLDCDQDALLLKVEQVAGIACHTGRHSCFFQKLEPMHNDYAWSIVEPVLKTPEKNSNV